MTATKEKTLEEVVALVLEEAERALENPYEFKKDIKNVAVIGAGPSGLPSARHLRDAGFNVRVFERKSLVGGLWVYSEQAPLKPKIPTSRATHTIESEVLDVPAEGTEKRTVEMTPEIRKLLLKKCPPSACYRDLYGNNDSHMFALPGHEFPKGTPKFASHEVIMNFFQEYAEKYDLLPMIEFDTSVDLVKKNKEDDSWELFLSKYDVYPSGLVRITRWRETFDGVVCASGIHQKPFVPDFKDLTAWNKIYPDKAMHSSQFRRPEDFKDKNVLIIGGSISGCDLVRCLDGIAQSITLSMKDDFKSPYEIYNIIRSTIPKSVVIKPNVTSFSNSEGEVDGSVSFDDGSVMDKIDQVFFCTGYTNSLGYFGDLLTEQEQEKEVNLNEIPESHVVVNGSFPLNLYQEVFLISDPTVAFVGFAPYFIVPTYFDTHAQAVARVWSGNARLPTTDIMNQFTEKYNLGLGPGELYNADRRRKEHFSTWLNHHAKALHKDLPEVENFPESWEKDGAELLNQFVELSTKNFEATKEYIKKKYM